MIRFPSVVAAVILVAAAAELSAQDSASVSLIQAGRLLDRPGNAPRGASTIVVRDGKIEAVREGFVGAEAFPGARVIDLRQHFVLPGLIDSHVHLESDRAGDAGLVEAATNSDAYFAYEAALNARKTLLAGFTTVRNLGTAGGVTLALRDAVAAGKVPGPRILDAGDSISTTSGHSDATLGLAPLIGEHIPTRNLCDGVEACRRAVRLQIGRGVDVIKIMTTGGVNSRIGVGVGKQIFDDEAQALIETAHLYGKKVAVHAHGADGINVALKYGADSIEHGTLIDDESIKLFLKSGAYYVPTLSTINGYKERIAADPNAYPPDVRAKIDWRISITGQALEKAYPRGVKIAFGTDAGVSRHGRNADEFELMVKHGMPPAQAIKAATLNAADLLGLSALTGSIEPGKQADVIAVSGDPLADVKVLKRMAFVMKNGQVYLLP
jgi:imidazolonepropionase-like amidohydrolase